MELEKLKKDKEFIDFYIAKEDKWLQNSNLDDKIKAIFGNIENAKIEFEKYKVENGLIEIN